MPAYQMSSCAIPVSQSQAMSVCEHQPTNPLQAMQLPQQPHGMPNAAPRHAQSAQGSPRQPRAAQCSPKQHSPCGTPGGARSSREQHNEARRHAGDVSGNRVRERDGRDGSVKTCATACDSVPFGEGIEELWSKRLEVGFWVPEICPLHGDGLHWMHGIHRLLGETTGSFQVQVLNVRSVPKNGQKRAKKCTERKPERKRRSQSAKVRPNEACN